MIDEQHPMQIGMFPMAMKCHTPQQQLQQQLQQQQQQQQHLQQQLQHPQQNDLLFNGNERLLTTTTAAATTTATSAGVATNLQLPQTTAQLATNVKAMTLDAYANNNNNNNNNSNSNNNNNNNHTSGINKSGHATMSGNGHVPCNRMLAGVHGSCHNGTHSHNGNNTYGESNGQQCAASKPNNASATKPSSQHMQQQQQQQTQANQCGPGPPATAQTPSPTATLVSNNANALAANMAARVALGECNALNNSTNNNNNNINNNSNGENCSIATALGRTDNVSLLANGNEQHHTTAAASASDAITTATAAATSLTPAIIRTTLATPPTPAHTPTHTQMHMPMPPHGMLQTPHSPQHMQSTAGTTTTTPATVGNALQQVNLLGNGLPLTGCNLNGLMQHNSNNNNNNHSDSITASLNMHHANNNGLPLQLTLPTLLQHQQHHQQQQQQQQHHLPQQQCGYCCQPICDRYIMRVVDTSFHESCLKCANCGMHLVNSCYARDGKLYCRIDYERIYIRNRCLGCGHKIASDELVMRTYENVFHIKCFACVVCGAMLKKGEQYVVKQGQLFCRFDYEKEVEMLQGYDFYGDDMFPPKMDGRRGPKRPRTILNTQQRRAFKASFEMSPKPCRKVRENLAKETGLSLRIVQVWFQNQRAKVKKIQKKAKQEPTKGTSDSQDSQESDSSLAKIKDEAQSDSESLLESPYSSCGGSANGLGSSLDAIGKLRCIKEEQEHTPFNCMETNKENCNKTNEPILNTILGLSYATFQQLMGPFTQTPMINPIDRLYSMQNSYFRPDELGYGECGKESAEH